MGDYGAPAYDERFTLEEGLGPDNRTLLNALPLTANAKRTVRELGWRAADCALQIWFVERGGEWTAVHALRRSGDGEH